MKTPKSWSDNIKNGIITDEMLDAALFSVNKRAKNYRDMKRTQYGVYRDISESKQNEMYAKKEKLLSLLKPVCIHREKIYNRIRVYDYQSHYNDLLFSKAKENKIVWMNSYLDYNNYTEVSFFDYLSNDCKYNYYLFYELGQRSYHVPILKIPPNNNLKVIEIGCLSTHGEDISDLCSVQFVDKLISLINSHNFIYNTDSTYTVSQNYDNIPKETEPTDDFFDEKNEFSKLTLAELFSSFYSSVNHKINNWIKNNLNSLDISNVNFDKSKIDTLVESDFSEYSSKAVLIKDQKYINTKNSELKHYKSFPYIEVNISEAKNFFKTSEFKSIDSGVKMFIEKYGLYKIPEDFLVAYAEKLYYDSRFEKLILLNNIKEVPSSKLKKLKKRKS